jgi:hypothetical protein
MGEWESGRVGEWENGRMVVNLYCQKFRVQALACFAETTFRLKAEL